MAEAEHPLREVVLAHGHYILAEAILRPTPLTIEVADDRVSVTIRVATREPPLTPCEADILALLRDHPYPLTTGEVLREFARAAVMHGDSTVKKALSRLVRRGLTRSRNRPPRGYELVPEAPAASA